MDLTHRLAVGLLVITLLSTPYLVECENARLTVDSHDITVIIPESKQFTVELKGALSRKVNVMLGASHPGLIEINPNSFDFNANTTSANGFVKGISPGHVEINATVTPEDAVNVENLFIRVLIAKSSELIHISSVIGWIYFVAWSVSFYPQIYINFRRKSVVGLNFDFLSLNVIGFILYGVFNVGLYSIPEIQDQYAVQFPRSLNPVQLNDVFFAVHATLATLITIVQCFIYERGDQRVSIFGKSLISVFAIVVAIAIILGFTNVINWLNFLYICSYVKLSITLIKYVPQAYMNYQRKSTIGWSIGNVLLDFTGGILSMLQMILNAYNFDDWVSIFGDPTKFGLGLFSVMFDIVFLLQHYVFYRNLQPYAEINGDNNESTEIPDDSEVST